MCTVWISFYPLHSWRRGTPSLWPPGSWSPEGRRRSEQESRWWPGPLCPHLSRGEPTKTRGREESEACYTEWNVQILAVLWLLGLRRFNIRLCIWYSLPFKKVTNLRQPNSLLIPHYSVSFVGRSSIMKDKQIVTVVWVPFIITRFPVFTGLHFSQLWTFWTEPNKLSSL